MPTVHPYTFSIVVLAKNEELNVPFVINQLLQKYDAHQIVFVLDGNREPTARLLSDAKIRFMEGNGTGKGSAIRSAIQQIQSDILVFMDSDGSHDPDEIGTLLGPLMNNDAELVIGSRFMGASEELSGTIDNMLRNAGNRMTNTIINALWNRTDRKISDTLNGFKGIKRSFFSDIKLIDNSFAIEMELVIKCLKKGGRIRELPSFELKRMYGQSHISMVHLMCFINCLIKNLI